MRDKNVKTAAVEVGDGSIAIREGEARVGGYRLRYQSAGTGPALLLVHGLMGYSFSWRFNISALARHFTVYAPDMVGTGFSEHPLDADYTLRGSAGRLLEFVEQLGVKSLNLVGTSHGGGVATMMAAMAKERGAPRIEQLVLVAPINPWSRHGKKRVAFLSNPVGAFGLTAGWKYMRRYLSFFLGRMYGDRNRVTDATLNGYAANLAQKGTAEYGLAVVRVFKEGLEELSSTYPTLAGIPTLLVWGDRDCAVSPESAYELQRALPGSELKVLPGIGHLPYEELPDEFNRMVLEFLRHNP